MKNELKIDEFYLLRVGSFKFNHEGDLYDNLYNNQWLAIARCYEGDDEILLLEGFNLPLKIYVEQLFWDLVPMVVQYIQTEIKQDILIGILRSAFDQDMDGLIDAGVSIKKINILPENQIVDYSKISHYSIVSKTISSDDLIYRINEGNILLTNGAVCKLGDLFGRVDEDESWAVFLTDTN